jgi:hypothetical protein
MPQRAGRYKALHRAGKVAWCYMGRIDGVAFHSLASLLANQVTSPGFLNPTQPAGPACAARSCHAGPALSSGRCPALGEPAQACWQTASAGREYIAIISIESLLNMMAAQTSRLPGVHDQRTEPPCLQK